MAQLKSIILFLFMGLTFSAAAKKAEPVQQDSVPLDSLKSFAGLDVLDVTVDPVGGMESAEFSFGITAKDGEIYYSSLIGKAYSRTQIESNEYFKFLGSKPQVDLFKGTEAAQQGALFSDKITTDESEGALSFSPDGKELLFTRAQIAEGKKRFYISYAFLTDSGWVESRTKGFSSNVANFAYPSWDNSGTRVYFCSDKQGGAGGMDIYYAEKQSFGWSAPRTMPKGINTAGDELYPQMVMDSLLVYATDGNSEFGGLDLVFAGTKREYLQLFNFKEPLNSADDDVQMVFVTDTMGKDSTLSGYLISNRKAEKDKLYRFSILLGTKKKEVEQDSIITVEADFLLDDRLTDYAKEILSELQQGLRDIYGSGLTVDIGPVSDGSDGLEKGKRLVGLEATVEESLEQEVQFLMANAIENLLQKEQMLESLENEALAGAVSKEELTATVEINVPGAIGRDVENLIQAYADQLIRDYGIPAAVTATKLANGDTQILFETSASQRDKERVADEIRNVLTEIENNHNFDVAYGDGSYSASGLTTDYIFSGDVSVTISRAGEAAEVVQEIVLDIDDSVDVFIEVFDAKDYYAGRRLRPAQKVKLRLPSMDFAVDVAIADSRSIADYKKTKSGYSSMTLYDSNYDGSKQSDYSSSKLYTIQVASLKDAADADYFKGLVVNEYKCSDGFLRYTTGIARSSAGAERLLAQVQSAGFEGAFIIEVNMIEKRLEKVYSVIIASGPEKMPAYTFPAGWKVAEYIGKVDDNYRYAVGQFDKIETALAELNRVKKLGYKGAFIDNIRRFNFQKTISGLGR